MDENNKNAEDEVRKIRHTISGEETFTLAKDVYDLRCAIKKIYANRAQIARRLNLLSLVFSLVYTAIYVALMLYLGVTDSLSQGWQIAVCVILGAYAALVVALGVSTFVAGRGNSKTYRRNGRLLKTFRLLVRVATLVMAVIALSAAYSQGAYSVNLALRTTALIFSVIAIIFSLIPIIFGSLGGLARWLLKPTKVNKRMSAVVLEWYGCTAAPQSPFASTGRVEKAMLEDISRCVDGYILPAIGRRKVGSVGANLICAVIELVPQPDRHIVEGILRNVFDYAVECNYVASNPCRDLNLRGSIEVYEKPKKPPLKVRIGKKLGSAFIKQLFSDDDKK